mmetsp:Transcript_94760/g.300666  ORF Transcript_94760/g.300666 Transcript_94760/m.300666 type:complete len:142 (+) Transcript_94760:42-467(+)
MPLHCNQSGKKPSIPSVLLLPKAFRGTPLAPCEATHSINLSSDFNKEQEELNTTCASVEVPWAASHGKSVGVCRGGDDNRCQVLRSSVQAARSSAKEKPEAASNCSKVMPRKEFSTPHWSMHLPMTYGSGTAKRILLHCTW